MSIKIYRANVIHAPILGELDLLAHAYVVVENGLVKALGRTLADEYAELPVEDFGDKILIPGFVDIHVHAPQYGNLGLGFDEELLPWLEHFTFPEEAKYADPVYAREMYAAFVHDLWKKGTTRAVIFASLHPGATEILYKLLEAAGLGAYVGLVSMDRNSPDCLRTDTEEAIAQARFFLESHRSSIERGSRVRPILTPRFVPSCSAELMQALAALAGEYSVPVQSHLSENLSEIEWVKALHPDSESYADCYRRMGLWAPLPTLMAHCVHTTDEAELALLAEEGLMVAHCPTSNSNLSSGIAPIRRFLEHGIKVGLGSDVGAGHSLSMPEVIRAAVQQSKLRWALQDKQEKPLTLAEAFYLATTGGAAVFGKCGNFQLGYHFDALLLDDADLMETGRKLSLSERLQRYLYCGDDRQIVKRFVDGQELDETERPC